jgi:hypothetical protein
MGKFENLQLNGPGKQYHMDIRKTLTVEQGNFKDGMLHKGIRVFKDKIEFADE